MGSVLYCVRIIHCSLSLPTPGNCTHCHHNPRSARTALPITCSLTSVTALAAQTCHESVGRMVHHFAVLLITCTGLAAILARFAFRPSHPLCSAARFVAEPTVTAPTRSTVLDEFFFLFVSASICFFLFVAALPHTVGVRKVAVFKSVAFRVMKARSLSARVLPSPCSLSAHVLPPHARCRHAFCLPHACCRRACCPLHARCRCAYCPPHVRPSCRTDKATSLCDRPCSSPQGETKFSSAIHMSASNWDVLS